MIAFLLGIRGGVRSTQAEKGQDRHDHDDQSDEINQAVHLLPPSARRSRAPAARRAERKTALGYERFLSTIEIHAPSESTDVEIWRGAIRLRCYVR
jgi:hypothetical protein